MRSFSVRVMPRASRREVVEEAPGKLKVYVTAAPEDGKANEAVRELLAEYFHAPKTRVRILKGEKSRNKIVEINEC